jgi:hypothetical protein
MIKMKSERPLLVNGVAQTEFETTEQHGKELIAAGLAEPVEPEQADAAESTAAAVEEPAAIEEPAVVEEPAVAKRGRAAK